MQRPEQPQPKGAACDLRAALGSAAAVTGSKVLVKQGFTPDQACSDFATHHAGMPAKARWEDEPAVIYQQEGRADLLLGLYGSEHRLQAWCPALREGVLPRAVEALTPIAPVTTTVQHEVWDQVALGRLPIPQSSPRDAGAYVTMGFVMAGKSGADLALSAHRMLVLDDQHLGISMLSSRHLRRMAQAAWARGEDLPVSINIGVPPSVAIASATATTHLPAGMDKLSLAGGLAQAPIEISQGPSPYLSQSEFVLQGRLTAESCAETLGQRPTGVTMPEFLGYDGHAGAPLQVLRVTSISQRPGALFQATLGPGREQSAILGLGGALALSLALKQQGGLEPISDLRFSPAGGGMLLLFVALRSGAGEALDKAALARRLIDVMPFTKTVIFVDQDVELGNEADVFWALTTRCNLGGDAHLLPGFAPLRMDPSQGPEWAAAGRGAACRTWVDATVPQTELEAARRSF